MTATLDITAGDALAAVAERHWETTPDVFARWMTSGRWKPYRYQQWLADEIAWRLRAGNARIIVNAPPRIGKSALLSKWTPMWWLDLCPNQRVMMASYGQDLASDYGREIRNEMERNQLCRARLREDSSAANRWNTDQGGGMVAVGIGGPATGRGYNLGVIDDVLKNMQDAYSHTIRRRQIEWFQSVFYQRREPNASIIVCMHRMHEDDLCGWLQREHSDTWTVIRLPSIAEEGDLMGRAVGEALCPERFDVDALEATRLGSSPQVWDAMHQQRPSDARSGRVYANFDSAVHIDPSIKLDPALPLCLSLDFNINPGMHAEIGQWNQGLDLLTAHHEIHAARMTLPQCMEAFITLYRSLNLRFPEVHLFGDATGKSESWQTGYSSWAIAQQALNVLNVPIRIRVPKNNPPVIDSMHAVNAALKDVAGKSHYKVHPRCARLIDDYRNLRTDEFGMIDKAESDRSHGSDCERYRIQQVRPLRSAVQERVGGRFSVLCA